MKFRQRDNAIISAILKVLFTSYLREIVMNNKKPRETSSFINSVSVQETKTLKDALNTDGIKISIKTFLSSLLHQRMKS